MFIPVIVAEKSKNGQYEGNVMKDSKNDQTNEMMETNIEQRNEMKETNIKQRKWIKTTMQGKMNKIDMTKDIRMAAESEKMINKTKEEMKGKKGKLKRKKKKTSEKSLSHHHVKASVYLLYIAVVGFLFQ